MQGRPLRQAAVQPAISFVASSLPVRQTPIALQPASYKTISLGLMDMIGVEIYSSEEAAEKPWLNGDAHREAPPGLSPEAILADTRPAL